MAKNSDIFTTSSTITDGEFQAIITFISAVLTSGGITKTSDTGQIDPGGATFPGSNNTSGGYEIRQFTDTESSTTPVILKINYRRGAGANTMQLGISIGSGSDGSGNLTSGKMTEQVINIVSNTSATQPFDIQATTNSFALATPYSTTSQNRGFIGLERTRDAGGEVTGQGLMLVYKNPTSAFNSIYVDYNAGSFISENSIAGGCMMPGNQTTGTHSSGDTAVYPYHVFAPGEVLVPPLNIVGGFSGNFTDNSEYDVSVLGAIQRMKAIHSQGIARGGAGATAIMLMRWES